MIAQAQARQDAEGLTNLTWLVGDAVPLPFPDNVFSVVVTRYSFHHLLDPNAVLASKQCTAPAKAPQRCFGCANWSNDDSFGIKFEL